MANKVFSDAKVSIIIPVFKSYGIVRRQLLYFKKLNLPETVEIIIMDDGSDPPIKRNANVIKNCNIYPTGDTRPWTIGCARNLGAKIADGEYLFFTDIDHILTREAIDAVLDFSGDIMRFPRTFAVLDNRGNISIDEQMLFKYGLEKSWFKRRGRKTVFHVSTFAVKKTIFRKMGGFNPAQCGIGYPSREDRYIDGAYNKQRRAGACAPAVWGPEVHVFPRSNRNPMGLFHDLERTRGTI